MKILIASANEKIVRNLLPHKALQIEPNTKNTSILTIGPKSFEVMRDNAKEKGYNPYALFTW